MSGTEGKAAFPVHGLTHQSFTDGRLTPACICGWWSADGSHTAFERHIKATGRVAVTATKGERRFRVWPGGLSGRVFAGWMTFDGERWVNDAQKHDVTDDVNAIVVDLGNGVPL